MEIKGRSITIEGVENVRRLVEALVGGDVEAAVDLCDTDVEVEESPRWPDRRAYRGREGARQAYEAMLDAFEDVRFEAEDFRDRRTGRSVPERFRPRKGERGRNERAQRPPLHPRG